MKKTDRRIFIQIMVLTLVLMLLPVHVMAEEDTSVNSDENQNEITETNVEEPTQEVFEDPTPVIVDIPQEGGDDTYIPQDNNDDNQYLVEEEKKVEEEKISLVSSRWVIIIPCMISSVQSFLTIEFLKYVSLLSSNL